MSAKELKAIADIGMTLGYSGDELKQFVNVDRMRMDKEKKCVLCIAVYLPRKTEQSEEPIIDGAHTG